MKSLIRPTHGWSWGALCPRPLLLPENMGKVNSQRKVNLMKSMTLLFLALSLLIPTGLFASSEELTESETEIFSTVMSSAEDWETYQSKLESLNESRNLRNHPRNQTCHISTWCPRGYRIWCYAEGRYCSSNKGERSWVWCASYDARGRITYQGSDRCY